MTDLTINRDLDPCERNLNFIRDYAVQMFGIDPRAANPLAILVEIGFDEEAPRRERLAAADKMLKYTHAAPSTFESKDRRSGPDVLIQIMGEVDDKGKPLTKNMGGVVVDMEGNSIESE